MATLIKTDGTETEVKPKNGRSFSLAELRELIGCEWLDFTNVIHVKKLKRMAVDDNGINDAKPINVKATECYHARCRNTVWPICGDVVICEAGELS